MPSPLAAFPSGLPRQSALVVALSGGLDSTVLLHLLVTDPVASERPIRAVHVDHGLHPESAAWARACARLCDSLDVPLHRHSVKVARDSGMGLEAAARHARHAVFENALGDDEILVLAHHRDDQAETFLLRALRASGTDGLAAMRAWRRHARGWLWRPLLDAPRAALLDHANTHGLQWIEDPSNADTAFDRNFLRQQVMPLLRQRWPQAGASLARCATLNAEAADLLAVEDARLLAQAGTADPRCLSIPPLASIPRARRQRVLRHWISGLGLPALPANGVERVEQDLLGARDDAEAVFAWQGARIRRWRGLLHASIELPDLPTDWRVEWDGRAPLPLPHGGELRLEGASALPGACIVHARQGGERIALPRRQHQHALKQVLQTLEVPPWVRQRMPLLSDAEGTLIAAGDLVYAAGFDMWLRTQGARLRWLETRDA